MNRKKFDVHRLVLNEQGWNMQALQDVIEQKQISVVVTNSIYYETGKKYDDVIHWLKTCQQNHIRVIDITHFSKVDRTVDALLDARLFVSSVCRLAYLYRLKQSGQSLEYIEKFYVLYNPLDTKKLDDFVIGKNQKLALRKKLGIPHNAFIIGRFGRGDADKWDDRLVRTLPLLLQKNKNFFILLQAKPDAYNPQIFTRFSHNILSLPESNNEKEIAEHIQICDVLLQTSRIGESFGCAIAEGMYYGKPMVTSSTDFRAPTPFERDNGQLELVEDTINGYVCHTPQDSAQAIMKLTTEKTYNRISRANAEKARSWFDADQLTERLENYIRGKTNSPTHSLSIEDYIKRVKPESQLYLLSLWAEHFGRKVKRKLGFV
ncbi:MAG: glycosyltransferase family 4 protein [Candidatus Roizmanbacteria bacterium]|nr:glycosyltransferase family 4 protein [Candidatus Roizmanbacteria bacterium]